MSSWRRFPVIYEINAWVWLAELGRKYSRRTTFADVPEPEIQRLVDFRFDAVWLMGAWQRSPAARSIARQHDGLRSEYHRVLPDFEERDVVGSPYAIHSYTADTELGGDEGLAAFRERLHNAGMQLMLDFVANDMASDTPWVSSHPHRFVRGSSQELQDRAGDYFASGEPDRQIVLAHGRDPNFPSWTDTVQLDYRRADTRQAMTKTLCDIATRCDGVRCDMAMLVNNDIFLRTWGGELEAACSGEEFWTEAIRQVKGQNPGFLMVAEAYWDLEYRMQQLGFDYVYDKRLYDRIRKGDPLLIRAHLEASFDYQSHLLRFLENHDEPRAASVLGTQRSRANSTFALSLPGARLVHEGQIEGWTVRVPVQLGRRPAESTDEALALHYRKLLQALSADVFHQGEWKLLTPQRVSGDNSSHQNFIAFVWVAEDDWRLVAANLSASRSQCYLPLELPQLQDASWSFRDMLSDAVYVREADNVKAPGFYLDVPGYGYHLFELRPSTVPAGFTRKCSFREHKEPGYGIALSPAGDMLALAGARSKSIWLVKTGDCTAAKQLLGHDREVGCVAWSHDGSFVASGSDDTTIRLWDPKDGRLLHVLRGHEHNVITLACSPDGRTLVSGGFDRQVILWDARSGEKIAILGTHDDAVNSVAYSPDGKSIAAASGDQKIAIWDAQTRELRHLLTGRHWFSSISWAPDGKALAAGTGGGTIELWQVGSERPAVIREGHTARVLCVAFGADGRLLASKAADGTVRIWKSDTWEEVGVLEEGGTYLSGLAFHPKKPILVTRDDANDVIRIWHVELGALQQAAPLSESVQYAAAKIALVGDTGVGKTGLGWRLAKGGFIEHSSTHGEQFWVVRDLCMRRPDGTECEAVLWDFAGQPDYRLIHALFLDDVDLAIIVFDATNHEQTLKGVEYWIQQLSGPKNKKKILVAQRVDRGDMVLARSEMEEFCSQHGIAGGYFSVSAKTGSGIPELKIRIIEQIAWDQMTPSITTATFKRIKEYVLALKESPRKGTNGESGLLVRHADLRCELQQQDPAFQFSEGEMGKAVEHLASHGYVRILRSTSGQESILLVPDLLRNLASSFVLEARRNPAELGALDEAKLLRGEYSFPELATLGPYERELLLQAVTALFLGHNICFRETIGKQTLLVFPALINQKRPVVLTQDTEDDVSYLVTGPLENVYASLVVRLGYTSFFTHTDHWQNQAQYEMNPGDICGFRQIAEHEGEVEFILYYGKTTPVYTRKLFEGLFETFLRGRNVKVEKYPPVVCSGPEHHRQQRVTVISMMKAGDKFLFCPKCAAKTVLPQVMDIAPPPADKAEVERQTRIAGDRTSYESRVARLKAIVSDRPTRPSCFVSYAWGDPAHKRWVTALAKDLQNASVDVHLDEWDNWKIGDGIPRFVATIEQCDFVAVVGTPSYKVKYQNKGSQQGTIVAAEMDIIAARMMGTEQQKKSVLPLLRQGEEQASFPPHLFARVYADFRDDETYFDRLFSLLLTMYGVPPFSPQLADLEQSRSTADRLSRMS